MKAQYFYSAVIALMVGSQSSFADPKQICISTSNNLTDYKSCLRSMVPGSPGIILSGSVTKQSYCDDRLKVYPNLDLKVCSTTGNGIAVASVPYAEPKGCTEACNALDRPELYISGDPKCDRDPACKACVAGKMGSQIASYCSGKKISRKAKTNQTLSASLYGVTGVVCALGCFPYTASYAKVACPALGAATFLSDMAGLFKQTEYDEYTKGWVNSVSKIGTGIAGGAQGMLVGSAIIAGSGLSNISTKNSMNCVAGALYLAQAGVKIASLSRYNKAQKAICEDVEKFQKPSAASPVIAECKTSGVPATVPDPKNYTVATGVKPKFDITDPEVSALIGDSELDKPLRSLYESAKHDPALAKKINEMGQRIMDDGSVTGLMSEYAGKAPNGELDGAMTIAQRAENGEMLSALQDFNGSSTKYSIADGTLPKQQGEGMSSELNFGGSNVATPSESAEALNVGRAPASKVAFNSNDPFHAGDSRDLFRIASDQLKNQVTKKNVDLLTPDSRMNRMLSGIRSNSEAK